MASGVAAKLSMLTVEDGAAPQELCGSGGGGGGGAAAAAAAAAAAPPAAPVVGTESTAAPPPTRQAAALIDGVQTDVVVQAFANLVYVIVTQNRKLGTFVSANAKVGSDGALIFDTSVLLGKRDEPLLCIYARQILERMRQAGCAKPLLLAISLTDDSPESFRAVMDLVASARAW